LSATTDYYVVNAAGTTFQVSLTDGGAAVTFSDDGTGDQFVGEVPESIQAALKLLVSHWYEHREAYVAGTIITEVPMAVMNLLWQNRMPGADT